MRQRPGPAVPDDTAVVKNFLKLSTGFLALPSGEIRLSANVGWYRQERLDTKLIPPYSMGAMAGCRLLIAAVVSLRLSANCARIAGKPRRSVNSPQARVVFSTDQPFCFRLSEKP